MNYLGIDYGEKRIGLAKADGETKIATPFATVANDENIFENLADLVAREAIDKIILGVPVSFDGSENVFAQSIKNFGLELSKFAGKEVEFVNEVFSSKIASWHSNDMDASSAALILQSFLDAAGRG